MWMPFDYDCVVVAGDPSGIMFPVMPGKGQYRYIQCEYCKREAKVSGEEAGTCVGCGAPISDKR